MNIDEIWYELYGIGGAGHSGPAIWDVGLVRLDSGTLGSNPTRGMDIFRRISVLCCDGMIIRLRVLPNVETDLQFQR